MNNQSTKCESISRQDSLRAIKSKVKGKAGKDVAKFLTMLVMEYGAAVEATAKGHLMVYNPNGVGQFLVSGTTGAPALKKIVGDAFNPAKGGFPKA